MREGPPSGLTGFLATAAVWVCACMCERLRLLSEVGRRAFIGVMKTSSKQLASLLALSGNRASPRFSSFDGALVLLCSLPCCQLPRIFKHLACSPLSWFPVSVWACHLQAFSLMPAQGCWGFSVHIPRKSCTSCFRACVTQGVAAGKSWLLIGRQGM